MSTRLYLECRTHDPLITDDSEVGNSESDLPEVQRWLDERDEILGAFEVLERFNIDTSSFDVDFYGTRYWLNAVRFMREHPKCVIGIRDEYGREHPVMEDS